MHAEAKTCFRTRSWLVLAAAAILCGAARAEEKSSDMALPMAPGPFQPTMQSLKQYKYPQWFRDAKLALYAHWGPQCVPMMGDWYARNMYIQGHRQYKHHLENYGHPSTAGYKDIIPLWKAEKWDPDRLMALYKRAGARYFVSMGCHHDNFCLWNSKLHKWNAVNMGPKRDVVGLWQQAAKKYGLPFGVSEHLGASFNWFQVSHKADKTGPLAGVPYDGANPLFEDLYHFPSVSKQDPNRTWYTDDRRFQRIWYDRIKELVDAYQPDLLFTDGPVPFNNEVGLSLIAHYYNADAARHGGRVNVVYNCKQPSEGRWVEDIERGGREAINPEPWQSDTSVADWFYDKNWKYREARWILRRLVEVVSKNGSMLLNIVQRPDGSLDREVQQILEEMARWTDIYGEAIYATRPWAIYGEGPAKNVHGAFKEDVSYTAADIRFTTKGDVLYAIAQDWPADNRIVVHALAAAAGQITSVSVLGCAGRPDWQQTAAGLVVKVPAKKVCEYTCALKIRGVALKPAR